jgi:transcriptional regulator with XRE-family HTH domain
MKNKATITPTPIALEITALREALGDSQPAFARRCGIAQPTLWAIERGQYGPRVDTLLAIAEATGTVAILGAQSGKVFVDPGK